MTDRGTVNDFSSHKGHGKVATEGEKRRSQKI